MSSLDQLRAALVDRYRIDRELGRGGMGAVYLARDLRLDRAVAIKVLPPEFASQVALRERFLRETRTAASFSHPNIVPVYAIEESGDLVAYVMGLVEGESLAARVARAGPLGARDIVRLLQDLAYGLSYAHGRGIVHRDIKPDNIMIERATGRALLMDFGVARVITPATSDEGLTRVGEVVGTPEYMSPEQATGDHVDGRSDLYSLGLVAYFAVTGRTAMGAESASKVFVRQITEILPSLAVIRPELPAPLAAAIDRCLIKEPSGRFQRAEELVEALDVSQLAAPEIPIGIRLFAQELGTLSMILLFGALFAGLIWTVVLDGKFEIDNLDILIPPLLIVGVVGTRALQTLSEGRRLMAAGFTPGDLHRGLTAVVVERQRRREELAADARIRRARRRAVRAAGGLVALSIVLDAGARIYRTRTINSYVMDTPGIVLSFFAVLAFGTSVALFLRSPLRMPVGERFFRWVWLGAIGKGLLWLSSRGLPRQGATGTFSAGSGVIAPFTSGKGAGREVVRVVPADSVVAAEPAPRNEARMTDLERVGGADAIMAALERANGLDARVTELERWRRGGR